MTEPDDALSLEMVTAALRMDSADVAVYTRVLTKSLSEALPPGYVTVERERSMSDRMRGRPGEARIVINTRQRAVRCREDNVRSLRTEVHNRFNRMDFCGHRTPHMRD